jgi:hypothetical protein
VTVQAGDLVMLHLFPGTTDPNPPALPPSETLAKDQVPASTDSRYVDTAWDFFVRSPSSETGSIRYSHRVLTIRGADDTIQDAVAFAQHTPPATFTRPSGYPSQLQQLQALGLWSPASCGGALCTYDTTPSAVSVSADWSGLSNNRAGDSVSRTSVSNPGRASDWVVGPSSWGSHP